MGAQDRCLESVHSAHDGKFFEIVMESNLGQTIVLLKRTRDEVLRKQQKHGGHRKMEKITQ
jgi:hypothetical protein